VEYCKSNFFSPTLLGPSLTLYSYKSYPFGWEPDSDGFRGHVFATPDNSTVIISIKGTSAGVFGGGGPTAKKDKFNDNLLFSCCCARIDWTWTTVCDCYRGGWKCDQTCLEDALASESLFYPIGTVRSISVSCQIPPITFLFPAFVQRPYLFIVSTSQAAFTVFEHSRLPCSPNSNIWMVGHSLGGALSSLVGVTFGLHTVTFESPGERLAATRLHLPSPVILTSLICPSSTTLTKKKFQPSTHHVTHIYHTADPIAMGTCNGILSSCALGGYAMETASASFPPF